MNPSHALDDVTSGLAGHLAHVAEPIPGLAEQLRRLTDVHRGVVCHSGDRELELVDLLGDGPEGLEVDLAPCGGGGVGGCRHDVSDWFDVCTLDAIPGTATTPWRELGKAAATVTSGPISYSSTASAAPMSSNSSVLVRTANWLCNRSDSLAEEVC